MNFGCGICWTINIFHSNFSEVLLLCTKDCLLKSSMRLADSFWDLPTFENTDLFDFLAEFVMVNLFAELLSPGLKVVNYTKYELFKV